MLVSRNFSEQNAKCTEEISVNGSRVMQREKLLVYQKFSSAYEVSDEENDFEYRIKF